MMITSSPKGDCLSELSEATSGLGLNTARSSVVDSDERTARWYAVRTLPRHEKRVRDRIQSRDLECYLPLFQTLHRWNNGCKAQLELPLFPSYLFASLAYSDRGRLLSIPGVHSLVGAGNRAVPLPHGEIEALRDGLHLRNPAPHALLTVGQKVRIAAGPLAGLCGILLRQKHIWRVVLSIQMLMQAVAVEIDARDVQVLASQADAADRNPAV